MENKRNDCVSIVGNINNVTLAKASRDPEIALQLHSNADRFLFVVVRIMFYYRESIFACEYCDVV